MRRSTFETHRHAHAELTTGLAEMACSQVWRCFSAFILICSHTHTQHAQERRLTHVECQNRPPIETGQFAAISSWRVHHVFL